MKEDKNISLTRAVACFMIVLVHVGEQRYYNAPVNTSIFELSALAIVIGRVAVPIFFMISGFLLFSKNKYKEFDLQIFKNRFLAIFVPLVFFTAIYYGYTILKGFNPLTNPKEFNEYFSESISHLWYLGYILPVYTFSPFIHIPSFQTNKQLWAFLGIITFFFFITESIMSQPYNFKVSYSFNQALLYMFTGYILKQFSFTGRYYTIGFALIFVLLIQVGYFLLLYAKDFTFSFQYGDNQHFEQFLGAIRYFLGDQEQVLPSYKTLAVFLQSIALFLFFQSLDMSHISDKVYQKISYIAKHSLKIYGWHMIFIIFISELNLPWNDYAIFTLSFVSSILGALFFSYMEDAVKHAMILHKI
ncbi:MAG: acyltransferase [Brevinema sp.]